MHRIVVAIALSAACKGDKPADKPPEPAPASKPAAKPAAELFTGTTVTLPAPVAKLQLEMPEAAARSAAPDVFAAPLGYDVPGFTGVALFAQLEGGRLAGIRAQLATPVQSVKSWLTAKWGAPRTVKSTFVWNAPATGLRATLEGAAGGANLYFSSVIGLDALLGTGKTFGWEKVALLGAKREDVLAAFAAFRPTPRAQDPGSIALSIPPIEVSEYRSSVDVRVKGGVVTGYTFTFNYGDDAAVNAAFAKRLEAMFGTPTKAAPYLDYPGPPKVRAELRTDTGFPDVVWVGDYK